MHNSTVPPWLDLNATNLLDHAKAIVTGTFRISSTRNLISYPVRSASKLTRAVLRATHGYLPGHFDVEGWAAQARNGLTAALETGAGGVATGTTQIAETHVAPVAASGWRALLGEAVQAGTLKSYSGMLSYLTSRWAFSCFAMALVLNRVAVYGSSRQRIHLTWNRRLALRLIPVMLLIVQIHKLLQAIQCQSSPNFITLRFGGSNLSEIATRGPEWQSHDGLLHWMSSSVLFMSSDEDSCAARGMGSPEDGKIPEYGSYSLLWPTFVRLCFSHLLETISCSLQQMPVMTEVAMSLFEHSLAFAEVEIMTLQILGVSAFPSSSKIHRITTASNIIEVPLSSVVLGLVDAATSIAGFHRLNRVNVPVEVLLVTLLSCCNALTSNVISIWGKQRSLRLINTGFWGCCFIVSFVRAFLTESFLLRSVDGEIDSSRAVSSLLHFPTVVICGFVPHMIVLAGICCCLMIYSVALFLTAFSLTTNPNIPRASGIRDRFAIAHENLQVAIQVRGINFKWHEDFYTALLRVGFTALTAASEAVFLNEGRSVEMRQFTWLEEDRLDEVEASHSRAEFSRESTFQIAEAYGIPPSLPWATSEGSGWESGYAKERKLEKDREIGMDKIGDNTIVYPHPASGGVGAMQRTTRFYLLLIFVRGVLFLIVGYTAWACGVCLDRVGITTRPRWLRTLIGKSGRASRSGSELPAKNEEKDSDFVIMSMNGKLAIAASDELDIVPELRKRLLLDGHTDSESVLDDRVYSWFKKGGWLGTKDESSDYRPSIEEDVEDTTSVISMSTTASTSEYDSSTLSDEHAWESEPDGQRTPTRHSPQLISREATPEPVSDTTLDPATLARLLNPQDKASKMEARILAAHLANPDRITTRSIFRRNLADERSRVLLADRLPGRQAPKVSLFTTPGDEDTPHPLTRTEEAEILESLILSRRKHKPASAAAVPSTENGDFHAQGSSCVVCQASPRTIIAWPCRCLCVCEDCRVSLALNNFGNCVTCRRQVGGFVRLWVP